MKTDYKITLHASFIAYIVQAIVNNFIPLLFVMFQTNYNIPLYKITFLITINFIVQLIIDISSTGFADKIGYKASVIIAHICSTAGLILLTILPDIMSDAYAGIVISVVVYAIGGGLIEVLISPIVEACPTDNKEKAMSLLHSFYCWGCMLVVIVSSVFFALFGIVNWKILTLMWSIVPIMNACLFASAPIYSLHKNGETGLSLRQLFSKKIFFIMIIMMLCAGASEQAISQWASAFAEQELGISKTIGDLAGPMAFAALMGTSRLIYGIKGDKLNLDKFMKYSCLLCIFSYLCLALVPIPAINLMGCAVCGFSVGILWPGTFSKASSAIKGGGTALFAMLALAGDIGCSVGPTLVGMISSSFGNNLRAGIFAALIFPIVMILGVRRIRKFQD